MAKPEKSQNKARNKEITEKCRFITTEFRVSYPHVFKPVQYKGKGEFFYSLHMLIKKTADLSPFKVAMKYAKIDKFGPDKADWPDDLQSPVVDGDDPKFADKEGFKGHWVIKAKAYQDKKPGVVDMNGDDILDQSEFYPGCYARAQLFASVWDTGSEQGVRFILDHVQKTREGKPLSNRKSAKDVFGALAPVSSEDEEEDDDNSESF